MLSSEPGTRVLEDSSYECVRCGTRTTAKELSKLPNARCICGYTVFRKSARVIGRQLSAV
ncbi:MAG: RNA polymerase Rbp10 [Thaumarchaeota archaeon]|nr:MAG: RNA polymerase Rbp10 [Nitrososphaerota archaeon]